MSRRQAIVPYVGQSREIGFLTLFSGESDGALDPERKCQYMTMKRAILDRGGYEREHYITQTPELHEMTD
ncbi:MAG: hypothetical protein LBK01_00690 [Burkholderiaceae bacterium]|nr:hypothetical protein [Burkholderiaceae bacterium]